MPVIGGGGAPTDVAYLLAAAAADARLPNSVAAGAAPLSELGGTWGAPSVDATHSGSAHHAQLHAAAHAPAGGDAMAVDAAAATGSLRTLGTGALQAAVGTHTTPAMTAAVAGHVPTPPNNTTTFLRGDGTFAAPAIPTTYTKVVALGRAFPGNGAAESRIGGQWLIALADAAQGEALWSVFLDDWSSGDIVFEVIIGWDANAGNAVLEIAWNAAATNNTETFLGASTIVTETVAAPGVADRITKRSYTLAAASFANGDRLRLIFTRKGADGSDTYTGSVYLLSASLRYTATLL